MLTLIVVLGILLAVPALTVWALRSGIGKVEEPPGFTPITFGEACGLAWQIQRRTVLPVLASLVPGLGHAVQRRWRRALGWFGATAVFAVAVATAARQLPCTCTPEADSTRWLLAILTMLVGVAIVVSAVFDTLEHARRHAFAWSMDHGQARALAADSRQPSCPRCRAAERSPGGFCSSCAAQLAMWPMHVDSPIVRAAGAPDRGTDPALVALRATHVVRGTIGGDAVQLPGAREPRLDASIRRQSADFRTEALAAYADPAHAERLWIVAAAHLELVDGTVYDLRTVILVVLRAGKVAGTWTMSAVSFARRAANDGGTCTPSHAAIEERAA